MLRGTRAVRPHANLAEVVVRAIEALVPDACDTKLAHVAGDTGMDDDGSVRDEFASR